MKKRNTAAAKKPAVEPNSTARTAPDLYEVFRGESSGGASSGERLIHQRTRLAIVSMLAVNESLTFNELKEMLDATDGKRGWFATGGPVGLPDLLGHDTWQVSEFGND